MMKCLIIIIITIVTCMCLENVQQCSNFYITTQSATNITNNSAIFNAKINFDRKQNCSYWYAFNWGSCQYVHFTTEIYFYEYTNNIYHVMTNLTCDTCYVFQPILFTIPNLGCSNLCLGLGNSFYTQKCDTTMNI